MNTEKFRVSSIFSDHMVLQREKNIHIFGTAKEGSLITVSLTKIGKRTERTTVIAENNSWLAILPPMDADTGYELNVQCNDATIIFKDIAIGEVWLAGGQSNMEYELQNAIYGNEHLRKDHNSKVRFYYTQKKSYMDEDFYESERKTTWQLFDEKDAACWSAVGYFYAKELSERLNVTVGVIGCNWGGTSASAWVSRKTLEEHESLHSYIEEYDTAIEGLTEQEQIKQYDEYAAYHEIWDKKCGQLYVENPEITWDEVQQILGVCQWPGPMNCKNPYRPAGLYECMLKRVAPYSMRGFLYYQGESDDHKPKTYYGLLKALIDEWRELFLDDELFFLNIQLPMHRYKLEEDHKNWPIIREAQMRAFKTVKNSGLAVIIDKGEFNEIHPKDKEPIGFRLAMQAMALVYHQCDESEAFGPIYKNAVIRDRKIEITCDYASVGFQINGEVGGFEIAGHDKIFYQAIAEFEDNKIYVSCESVIKPEYVRYLWTNYSEVNVFGKNGLPLAPFRTSRMDDVEEFKQQKSEIQQVMEV